MERFLQSYFGDCVSEERRIAIFCLPSKEARFFVSAEEAAEFASIQASAQNVYFGVGLVAGVPTGRGKYENIAAIAGLWADLDMAGPHREPGKVLPQSIEEIRAILAKLPFAPTLLVDSGHGVHAHWLFKEPWVFESEEDRTSAYHLSMGWNALICEHARAAGFALETLGDLTRVLRIPGTVNHNVPGAAQAVSLVESHLERRYNRCDFEPYVSAQFLPLAHATLKIALHPAAEPPADKFAELLLQSTAFARSWRRERADLPDQSQSAYDLSLATIAAMREWPGRNCLIATMINNRLHPASCAPTPLTPSIPAPSN